MKVFKIYICFLSLIILSVKGNAQQLRLNDQVIHQTMEGFGASDAWRIQFVGSNWPMEKRERIADLLFSKDFDKQGNPIGIGLSVWRFYVGSGSTELGDSSNIKNEWRRSESFLNQDGSYDWNKNKGQRWFLSAARERGVEKFLAFSIAPPTFYAINGKGYSIKGDERINVKPGYLDDYAEYLVEVVDHFGKEEGILFDYLSPINEPQWDWSKANQEGTAATNEDMYLFTKYLSTKLQKRNLSTQLVLGEAADIRFMVSPYKASGDQVSRFWSPSSTLYIGGLPNVKRTISGHSYFTTWPIDTLTSTRRALAKRLDEYEGLGYWQSEYCILENSSEIGDGNTRDLGMATALYVARVIHSDLTITNASSWQWWTALTTYDFKDGLVYLDTGDEIDLFNRERMKSDGAVRESKLLWALGNYSRFVRPGMVRIGAEIENGPQSASTSAYKGQSDDVVIVFTNHGSDEVTIKYPRGLMSEEAYLTDENHDLEKNKVGRKSVALPAKSIITIKAKYKN